MSLESYLEQKLTKRIESNNFRSLNRREGVDFISNDYLSLASNTYNNEALIGSSGSRLISGNHTIHEELELFLSKIHNCEAALIYNSAYMANIGLLSAISSKDDLIIYDEECHASIKDGIRLSYGRSYKFIHNNLEDLTRKLEFQGSNKFIVVESIYSMSGSQVNLEEILRIADKFNAFVIVDEAHTTGLYSKGAGLVNELNLNSDRIIRILGFGKAMGTVGGAILGSKLLKSVLINYSRSFIYTTALPPMIVEQIWNNYQQIIAENLNQKFEKHIKSFCALWNSKIDQKVDNGFIIKYNASLINLSKIQAKCKESGIDVKLIQSPTVPHGSEQLRITLHLHNTIDEFENLVQIIKQ